VTDHDDVAVTLPADVNQIDETGWRLRADRSQRPAAICGRGGWVEEGTRLVGGRATRAIRRRVCGVAVS
jgi:hypothetical protein